MAGRLGEAREKQNTLNQPPLDLVSLPLLVNRVTEKKDAKREPKTRDADATLSSGGAGGNFFFFSCSNSRPPKTTDKTGSNPAQISQAALWTRVHHTPEIWAGRAAVWAWAAGGLPRGKGGVVPPPGPHRVWAGRPPRRALRVGSARATPGRPGHWRRDFFVFIS
jgi:hypothetical protein